MRSPLRLYGRDAELAALASLLELLWRGGGGALVLAAPPGLGRTALLREAAEAHRDRGPVLYAAATGAMRSVPGGGLGALLGPGRPAPTRFGRSSRVPPPQPAISRPAPGHQPRRAARPAAENC
ncbi:predicted protein [Streptomyces filamentosus NRRL 15998]|uniref:Predicted protein n=1 Tax=Streptomyces filamentosus NRRL 15998 TaxID=457431 RepID=D6ARA8_STRFL|nr:AAA family ATPase [Streptomyces filamentosus]EFE73810.1 predicted protein [Streptomyces filamentosus NRRL 15998]